MEEEIGETNVYQDVVRRKGNAQRLGRIVGILIQIFYGIPTTTIQQSTTHHACRLPGTAHRGVANQMVLAQQVL